jgi:DNA-3-methyladenine glycosylase I
MEEMTISRCKWCTNDAVYQEYHDRDWGIPKYDDQTLFEMLILEGAQAGLSWITILKRRENYRKAFNDFDVNTVASYSDKDVKRLLQDIGIIRNGLKIKSAIKNAQVFIEIQNEYGSFSTYLWRYVNHTPIRNSFKSFKEVPVTSDLAKEISKDLKRRGMSFVGPIIIYSYMQSVGIVNDHTLDCYLRRKDNGLIS